MSDPSDGKSIDEKFLGFPDAVKACAFDYKGSDGDKVYYDRGACLCVRSYKCPFQSSTFKVMLDGNKAVVCERYHPKFQKPDSDIK